jgi:2'-5' RNA ligase
VRLFVALELPEGVRSALADWRADALGRRDDLRLVAPEALHVTLAFLGYRYEKDIERIAASAFAPLSAFAAPRLESAGIVPVPKRDPRLFALDLLDPEGDCAAIQLAVSDSLAGERFYKPEKRPFWPHVTLARVKKRVRRAPGVEAQPPSLDSFDAPAVTLYRSLLRPTGAVYEPLARLDLRDR